MQFTSTKVPMAVAWDTIYIRCPLICYVGYSTSCNITLLGVHMVQIVPRTSKGMSEHA